MTDATRETASSAVHGVTMRLPTFWPDRPAVYFAEVEAQFDLDSIMRQRTKFNYVVSQLISNKRRRWKTSLPHRPSPTPTTGSKRS